MIEVKNLTKYYGAKKAVDNLSFSVKPGEILGFLGPNGAGKSTTMNMITGYLSSTSGTVTVDGCEILADPMGVKSKIGYLPEHPPLYLDMTVKEYLSFMYDLKRIKLKKWSHIDEICALVQISDVFGRLIKNLSKGYRQRVGLAQALLGGPAVLILDEPTVGLDPKQIIEIRRLIQDLGKSHTIILSSHILPEIQAICQRVIVLSDGKLIADDTSDNLSKKMSADHSLTVRVDGPEEGIYALLMGMDKVQSVEKLGSKEPGSFDFLMEGKEGVDIRRDLFRLLAKKSWPILSLHSNDLSLEEIFLQLTDTSVSPDKWEDEIVEEATQAVAVEAVEPAIPEEPAGDGAAEENPRQDDEGGNA